MNVENKANQLFDVYVYILFRIHRAALWILGEYCTSSEDIQSVMTLIRQSLGEVSTELHEDIQSVMTLIRQSLGGVSTELHEDIQSVMTLIRQSLGEVSTELHEDIQSVMTLIRQSLGEVSTELHVLLLVLVLFLSNRN